MGKKIQKMFWRHKESHCHSDFDEGHQLLKTNSNNNNGNINKSFTNKSIEKAWNKIEIYK